MLLIKIHWKQFRIFHSNCWANVFSLSPSGCPIQGTHYFNDNNNSCVFLSAGRLHSSLIHLAAVVLQEWVPGAWQSIHSLLHLLTAELPSCFVGWAQGAGSVILFVSPLLELFQMFVFDMQQHGGKVMKSNESLMPDFTHIPTGDLFSVNELTGRRQKRDCIKGMFRMTGNTQLTASIWSWTGRNPTRMERYIHLGSLDPPVL